MAQQLLAGTDSGREPGSGRRPDVVMNVTKPYEFIGFGAMDVAKPYEFMGFGAMDATKPYEFIGFGAMHGRIVV